MKGLVKRLGSRAGIIKELFAFLWENKLWWMVPFVVVLVLFGILLAFAQASPASPFIYALF